MLKVRGTCHRESDINNNSSNIISCNIEEDCLERGMDKGAK